MPVDGVNRVNKDGRYKLPPALAEKYRDEYLAAVERDDGTIVLRAVGGRR